eukprot:CAMPEP_0177681284 /NCGR_PEP_ID=MMETSP0447-20121125/30629_1 /TAXON_ID=0 /ORGANISM="Stygamoeba regulata, Strain BSH-02190019" /LENGTH=183 /DNA_ID=CAMNT_0019190681 /DNA_START=110 /DNA_END=660 /DNA_ORIENTATION=-
MELCLNTAFQVHHIAASLALLLAQLSSASCVTAPSSPTTYPAPRQPAALAALTADWLGGVQGTHLERLVATRISTDGTRRLVTQLITQVVSHDTLALLLRLLCAHATSHSSHAATNHIAVAVRDTWDDVTGSTEPLPSIDDTLSERVRAGVARVAAAQRSAYVEAKACVEACVDGIVGEVLGW